MGADPVNPLNRDKLSSMLIQGASGEIESQSHLARHPQEAAARPPHPTKIPYPGAPVQPNPAKVPRSLARKGYHRTAHPWYNWRGAQFVGGGGSHPPSLYHAAQPTVKKERC